MPLKDALNNTLRRATGYSLSRQTPEQRQAELETVAREAAAQASRQGQEALERFRAQVNREKEERKARQEARRKEREARRAARLRNHLDDFTRATILQVKPWTMTGPPKLETLIEAVRHIARHRIEGDIVECGVWRGGSMQAVALTLMEQGDTDRELHLYDTFSGMSEPTAEDVRVHQGQVRTAAEMLAESDKDAQVWAVAGIDVVKDGMATTGYPAERVHYYPGMVEETIPDHAPERIALLRLDTDWYASTRHELEHLWDRLSPGGILIIDDYGDWEGARKAVDEWLERVGLTLFLAPMGGGRVAMKPMEG